jgi:hypothetical protein
MVGSPGFPHLEGFGTEVEMPANSSWLLHAVKAVRVVGSAWVKKVERVGRSQICGDGRPVDEIGGSLQHIIAACHPGKSHLELATGQKGLRGKIQRLHLEQGAGGHAVVVAGFEGIGGNRGVGENIKGTGIYQGIGRGQRAIQGVIERGGIVRRCQGDANRADVITAIGRNDRRGQWRRAGKTVHPSGDGGHAVSVDEVAREGRHFRCRVGRVHTLPDHGPPDVVGLDDAGIVKPKRMTRRIVSDVLTGQRGVVAGVEGNAGAAGLVALGAVGIQVGTSALLRGGRQIVDRGELLHAGDGSLVEGWIEQTQLVERAQLVISHAGGRIGLGSVQLPGAHAEHVIGHRRVAGQAVRRAGVIPGLGLLRKNGQ